MNVVFFISYFILCCAFAKQLARHGSFLAIPTSDSWRHILLILDYSQPRISIMCIISQIYTYFMLILYLTLHFPPLHGLNVFSYNFNELIKYLIKFHYIGIFPFSLIEIAFFSLINKFFNLRKWFLSVLLSSYLLQISNYRNGTHQRNSHQLWQRAVHLRQYEPSDGGGDSHQFNRYRLHHLHLRSGRQYHPDECRRL